jgi:uncharacterized repeat protein (TIGR02543 family)
MDSAKTATGNWKIQYYLTTSSSYGTIGGAGWFDSGSSVSATVSPLTVAGAAGTQYVFIGWSGDAPGSGSPSNDILMNGPKTATAKWKTQYYLTMAANFGSVSPGSGWHDAGSTVTISATASSAGSGERYVWNGWTGTDLGNYTRADNPASVVMNGSVTDAASWAHQYMLTVTSLYGSPTPISGWFDAGTSIIASVSSPLAGPIATEYICTGWAGTGSIPASGAVTSVIFTIDQPSSITWNWKTQYFLPQNLLVIIILTALIISITYLMLRKRHKGQSAGGAPEPTPP